MIILGIYGGTNPGQHDPAAALIIDGEIIAVCEEERYLRIKSAWGRLPIRAIGACLRIASITMAEVDLVVTSGITHSGLVDRTRTYLIHHFGACPQIEVINHHEAHLASAFYPSGFERAMCLSYDGYGDEISTVLAVGDGARLDVLETYPWENSLGVFYSAVTSYLGFEPSQDEYKVMGLASFGSPGIDLSHLLQPTAYGYEVDASHCFRTAHASLGNDEPLYGPGFAQMGPARNSSQPLERRHADLAYAAQCLLEESAHALVRRLISLTGLNELCLAGGVALNCTVNGVLAARPDIYQLWVQPAASDRGLALGCALHGAVALGGAPRPVLTTAALGGAYLASEMAAVAQMSGIPTRRLSDPPKSTAHQLERGQVVGWYEGRSEFGPRSLGYRSILADPRSGAMRARVNDRIKFRESFRPFAPAILEERAGELFGMTAPSPFMTINYPVAPDWRSSLEAVVHVDGTSRVQTVADGPFRAVIEEFEAMTGVPAVLNTSFNVRGEPIVESPRDAVATFAGSGLDALVMGDLLLEKPRS
jgi:carbamoyltransferase